MRMGLSLSLAQGTWAPACLVVVLVAGGSAAAVGYTAVDSGAFTAGRKGERLGWRNFKDCCRQEGLGTLWSGQSCRSNPIAACLEEWRGMGWGGGQDSKGGQAIAPLPLQPLPQQVLKGARDSQVFS